MDVQVVEMQDLRVGVVRSDMSHIQEAQGKLWTAVGEADLMDRPGVVAAAFMPVQIVQEGPRPDMQYAAAVILPEGVAIPDELVEDRVAGGRFARATHIGSYDGLGEAWGKLVGEWLPASGHEVGEGVCFEIYRNSPADVPGDELRTELYVPVR